MQCVCYLHYFIGVYYIKAMFLPMCIYSSLHQKCLVVYMNPCACTITYVPVSIHLPCAGHLPSVGAYYIYIPPSADVML